MSGSWQGRRAGMPRAVLPYWATAPLVLLPFRVDAGTAPHNNFRTGSRPSHSVGTAITLSTIRLFAGRDRVPVTRRTVNSAGVMSP